MNFIPFGDRLLIEKIKEEAKTATGIIMAKTKEVNTEKGKILATGPSIKQAQIGMTVYFAKFSGDPVELEGKEYLLISEEDILGGEQ